MSDKDSLSDTSLGVLDWQAMRLAALCGEACPSQAVIVAENFDTAVANLLELIGRCEISDNKVVATRPACAPHNEQRYSRHGRLGSRPLPLLHLAPKYG
jgi:hypothetical protein